MAREKDAALNAFVLKIRQGVAASKKAGLAIGMSAEEWAVRVKRLADELSLNVDPDPSIQAANDGLSPDELREKAVQLAATVYVLAAADEAENGTASDGDEPVALETEAA